ncbi:MAG: acyl-CoA dehydrogenase [Robiginitomaculum sp.]|nr:MAG: acyl-CoA dehydrogenase [Robiginitomaculum sp.]
MTYVAPTRELRFILEDVAAMEGLMTTGAFEDLSSDLTAAILEEGGKFCAGVLAPLNHRADQFGAKFKDGAVTTAPGFKEAYAQFVEGGWQGLSFDEADGGMGLPNALGTAFQEMLQSSNMAFGLCPMLTMGALEVLSHAGTEAQRTLYLPRLITGEWSASMNLTEPQAGSDVGALRTMATPVGDNSWLVEGQKIFITWGEHDCAPNIIHLVLARTPDATAGTKGLSLFLVPKFLLDDQGEPGKRNDARAIGVEHKLGIHASPTCVMEYGGNGGAKGWLIGKEGQGMAMMFIMMNSARLNVGAQGVGVAERAYQHALAYAQERKQGRAISTPDYPAAIIHHPDVRRMLMTMKAKITAARSICLACAVASDYAAHLGDEEEAKRAKAREELLTPLAKTYGSEIGVEVSSLALQIHGGMGYIEETGAAQHYRDARITPIYEGTNGIQAIDLVGRKLNMQGGFPMKRLIEEMRETVEDCATSLNPELPLIGARLASAIDTLEQTTQWLRDPTRQKADILAGATPYQGIACETVGGYYLAIGALAAQRFLEDGKEPSFAKDRIALARYFAETVLSAVPGKSDDIYAGSSLLFGIADADL